MKIDKFYFAQVHMLEKSARGPYTEQIASPQCQWQSYQVFLQHLQTYEFFIILQAYGNEAFLST